MSRTRSNEAVVRGGGGAHISGDASGIHAVRQPCRGEIELVECELAMDMWRTLACIHCSHGSPSGCIRELLHSDCMSSAIEGIVDKGCQLHHPKEGGDSRQTPAARQAKSHEAPEGRTYEPQDFFVTTLIFRNWHHLEKRAEAQEAGCGECRVVTVSSTTCEVRTHALVVGIASVFQSIAHLATCTQRDDPPAMLAHPLALTEKNVRTG